MKAPSEEVKQNSYNSIRNNSLNASYCSQRFKACGSIIDLMDNMVKVGQTMGYNIDGLGHKTKKGWIKELCTKNRVNFVYLQETKMKHIELVTINKLWGDSSYDYAFSSSLAPQELTDKRTLWDYLLRIINRWDGECVIMGDFNEVRSEHERYGSVFNVQSVAAFNNFISLASLIDLPLDGYAYTWYKKLKAMVFKIDFEKAFDSIRLSSVIPDLISDFESAFISNRKILDGPFILNELLSWCKYKKLKAMVFKVDFEKAFDSIRGLKQGGPLSPFLFILIMESLHLSFKKVMNAGLFTSISLDNSLTISHLFFADDAIFVGKWDSSNLKIILKVLKYFHMASGHKININKSKLIGYGVHSDEVETAARYIGCATFVASFSHLGVKVGGRMERINSWDDVVSKVTCRLSKWNLKTLFIGGRLTLIKSVLTSIPLYQMSSFKVPIKVLNILESIRRKFFNGIEGNERKLALISWDTVLASKKYGGLGVLSFFAMNRALLSKWVWHFYPKHHLCGLEQLKLYLARKEILEHMVTLLDTLLGLISFERSMSFVPKVLTFCLLYVKKLAMVKTHFFRRILGSMGFL
nr:RNA-directed DNA polymerase, eukaryota [Tanacetum cinerariifolium]